MKYPDEEDKVGSRRSDYVDLRDIKLNDDRGGGGDDGDGLYDPLGAYEDRRGDGWWDEPKGDSDTPLWLKIGIGAVSIVVAISLIAGIIGPLWANNSGGRDVPTGIERAAVLDVMDGRTIRVELEGQTETVRYIGIDPFELDSVWGDYATRVNSELLSGGDVVLQSDELDRDESGRLLRYVYVGQNMVNGLLLRNGLGILAPPRDGNDRYREYMEVWFEDAKRDGLGMWGDDDVAALLPD